MRTTLRGKITLLFMACAMLLAIPAVALADTVENNVVVDGNDTITAGGSTTIGYKIAVQGAGLDNQGGCNASDGTPATLTLGIPSGVSATGLEAGNKLTFNKCNEFKDVVFSSNTAGNYNINVSSISDTATTGGTYTNNANFTLKVNAAPVTNTKPALTLPANITQEATSASGAAVSYTATANDQQDGPLTPDCKPASGSTFALGTTTVNCSVTDSGGLSDSGSFTVTVRDTTAPSLTVPSSPVLVEATSSNGAVANFASQVSAQDAVDPSPTIACSPASGTTFALGTTQVSCTAKDATGNESQAKTFDVTVQDTTAPTLSNVPSNMNVTATSSSGAVVNYTNPTASDAVDSSPVVNCTPVSGSTFGLGETTVSCTATDGSNNTSAASTFKVNVTYSASAFLQPINMDGSSSFKLGSTVPVKFQLTGASAGITDAVANLRITKVDSSVLGTELEATTSTAASTGSLFRYDATSGQYIYNWGTKGYTVGTYQLRIDLGDGNGTRTVMISLRK